MFQARARHVPRPGLDHRAGRGKPSEPWSRSGGTPNPTKRVPGRTSAFALVFLFLGAQSAWAADERALLDMWQRHARTPDDHGAWVAACRNYVAAHPDDPLVPVVHGLAAWHLLKADQTETAIELLEPYLSSRTGELEIGAMRLAKSWMTRLDREQAVEALQAYYRLEVRYPDTLSSLYQHPRIPASTHPPRTDRFDTPWQYRLTGYTGVPGFRDQRYRLESTFLIGTSDFSDALEIPYGSRIPLVPFEVSTVNVRDREMQLVRFEPAPPAETKVIRQDGSPPGPSGPVPEVTTVLVGAEAKGVYVAYVGNLIIVVCDHLHWKVFLRPRP